MMLYSNFNVRVNPEIANLTEVTLENGTKNYKGNFNRVDPITIYLFKEFKAIFVSKILNL